jgi:hypothetical protein
MAQRLPEKGAKVVTSDGHLLGEVSEAVADCFKVDIPMYPDKWFTTDSISGEVDGEVRLNIDLDALGSSSDREGIEHLGFHVHRGT